MSFRPPVKMTPFRTTSGAVLPEEMDFWPRTSIDGELPASPDLLNLTPETTPSSREKALLVEVFIMGESVIFTLVTEPVKFFRVVVP